MIAKSIFRVLLAYLTHSVFVLIKRATGQKDFIAQASESADINNLGSGNGVVDLVLTLVGSAGADTPVSTPSTIITSADTPASTPSPTIFPTTSAATSLSTVSTNVISTISFDLGLESSTSASFTPVTATVAPIFEGTATTRPFPVSLGSDLLLASTNTVRASLPPPLLDPTGVSNYHTGRGISTGSVPLIYASGSGGAAGASAATGLPITNVGSLNNVSWTFSKSGMTLAPTMTPSQEHTETSRSVHTEILAPTTTPTPKDAETKRSIHTQTPAITKYAHTTGIKSTNTEFSTHANTSGFPSDSAASGVSMGSTARSSGPSVFTGVADKTLDVPFACFSILMLAGMAMSMF